MENQINNRIIITDIVNRLTETVDISTIKQLTSGQRELVQMIIRNNGHNWPHYEEIPKGDLKEILDKLNGKFTPRQETWESNSARWLKTIFSTRIGSDSLKNEISKINSDRIKSQTINANLSILLQTALPRPLLSDDLLSEVETLSQNTKQTLVNFLQEHFKLLSRTPDESSNLNNDLLTPLFDASVKYNEEVAAESDESSKKNHCFNIATYTLQQHYANTQDAFTAFATDETDVQKKRLNAGIKNGIESTKEPGLEKEHSWAIEGFKQPIPGLDFWLKISLEDTETADIHNMKFESRINGKDALDFKENKIVNVEVDLTPFQKDQSPLTLDQKQPILAFLRNESSQRNNNTRFDNLEFLSTGQQKELDKLHERLHLEFPNATQEIHRRHLSSS